MEACRDSYMTKEYLLESIAQSKIRWGVTTMPPHFYQEYGSDQPYKHLGFGAEGGTITQPQPDGFYA